MMMHILWRAQLGSRLAVVFGALVLFVPHSYARLTGGLQQLSARTPTFVVGSQSSNVITEPGVYTLIDSLPFPVIISGENIVLDLNSKSVPRLEIVDSRNVVVKNGSISGGTGDDKPGIGIGSDAQITDTVTLQDIVVFDQPGRALAIAPVGASLNRVRNIIGSGLTIIRCNTAVSAATTETIAVIKTDNCFLSGIVMENNGNVASTDDKTMILVEDAKAFSLDDCIMVQAATGKFQGILNGIFIRDADSVVMNNVRMQNLESVQGNLIGISIVSSNNIAIANGFFADCVALDVARFIGCGAVNQLHIRDISIHGLMGNSLEGIRFLNCENVTARSLDMSDLHSSVQSGSRALVMGSGCKNIGVDGLKVDCFDGPAVVCADISSSSNITVHNVLMRDVRSERSVEGIVAFNVDCLRLSDIFFRSMTLTENNPVLLINTINGIRLENVSMFHVANATMCKFDSAADVTGVLVKNSSYGTIENVTMMDYTSSQTGVLNGCLIQDSVTIDLRNNTYNDFKGGNGGIGAVVIDHSHNVNAELQRALALVDSGGFSNVVTVTGYSIINDSTNSFFVESEVAGCESSSNLIAGLVSSSTLCGFEGCSFFNNEAGQELIDFSITDGSIDCSISLCSAQRETSSSGDCVGISVGPSVKARIELNTIQENRAMDPAANVVGVTVSSLAQDVELIDNDVSLR